MWPAARAPDGDLSAFLLVRACVEPPAGIEPATPSLPSMVGPFGGQCGTSLRSIELQVAGLIDDREMGCCEAVRGAAAGKSLARSPVGCPVVAGLRDAHVRGSGNGSKPVELLERVTKEKAGCWTRRRAFAQVSQGSNIQLLPYPLVSGLRSDSNRRPSDYESDARRRTRRLQTDLACSR